jgi:hypothetical protein
MCEQIAVYHFSPPCNLTHPTFDGIGDRRERNCPICKILMLFLINKIKIELDKNCDPETNCAVAVALRVLRDLAEIFYFA